MYSPVTSVTQLAYVQGLLLSPFTNHATKKKNSVAPPGVLECDNCQYQGNIGKSQNIRAATDTRFWNAEMASNNGSVGKWEVVKKGKKNSNSTGSKNAADKKSGGGGRKALSESNLPTRRKCPWPSGVLLASDTASPAPLLSGANHLGRSTN